MRDGHECGSSPRPCLKWLSETVSSSNLENYCNLESMDSQDLTSDFPCRSLKVSTPQLQKLERQGRRLMKEWQMFLPKLLRGKLHQSPQAEAESVAGGSFACVVSPGASQVLCVPIPFIILLRQGLSRQQASAIIWSTSHSVLARFFFFIWMLGLGTQVPTLEQQVIFPIEPPLLASIQEKKLGLGEDLIRKKLDTQTWGPRFDAQVNVKELGA